MRTSRQLSQGLSSLQRGLTSRSTIPHSPLSRSICSQLIRSSLFQRRPSPLRFPISQRYNSTSREPSPLTDRPATSPPSTEQEKAEIEARREQEPAYQITFTCSPCSERSTHRISKHGYHKGSILITCPGCHNRHIISDHLKMFSDTDLNVEKILKQKGESITKGRLDGDMEWWDDGTVTPRKGAESETPAQLGSGSEEKPT